MMPYLQPTQMPLVMAGGLGPVRMPHVRKYPAGDRLQPSDFDAAGIPAAQRYLARHAATSCSAGCNVIGATASLALAESP